MHLFHSIFELLNAWHIYIWQCFLCVCVSRKTYICQLIAQKPFFEKKQHKKFKSQQQQSNVIYFQFLKNIYIYIYFFFQKITLKFKFQYYKHQSLTHAMHGKATNKPDIKMLNSYLQNIKHNCYFSRKAWVNILLQMIKIRFCK